MPAICIFLDGGKVGSIIIFSDCLVTEQCTYYLSVIASLAILDNICLTASQMELKERRDRSVA